MTDVFWNYSVTRKSFHKPFQTNYIPRTRSWVSVKNPGLQIYIFDKNKNKDAPIIEERFSEFTSVEYRVTPFSTEVLTKQSLFCDVPNVRLNFYIIFIFYRQTFLPPVVKLCKGNVFNRFCLSVNMFERTRAQYDHYPWSIGPHCIGPPGPSPLLLVKSGNHHCRFVQNCSLDCSVLTSGGH